MAVKRLYEREYGLEILVGDPQVQLGDDTILDILDGDLRGGGETGGIENGKLRIENFLLGREEFLQVNPAKRNVMVVKNEMRLLKQKRNVLQI